MMLGEPSIAHRKALDVAKFCWPATLRLGRFNPARFSIEGSVCPTDLTAHAAATQPRHRDDFVRELVATIGQKARPYQIAT
jgi:hypothetical protein